MTDNLSPYAPPRTAALEVEPDSPIAHIATRWRRLANFVLDWLGYFLIALVITLVLYAVAPDVIETAAYNILLSYPGYLIYYALFEGLTGRTPAKLITGTRVVDAYGDRPGFGKILLRSLARFIPFEPLTFLRAGQEGWHDTLTETHVVRTRPKKELP